MGASGLTPLDVFWDRCEGPIVYGRNDCCMVLADVIAAAGGPDMMASYRGRYSTRLGFVRAFRKAGHMALDKAVTAEFERCGVSVTEPRDFDVVMAGYRSLGAMVASPAFFHSGFWLVRSDLGGVAMDHATFEGTPAIYRVI